MNALGYVRTGDPPVGSTHRDVDDPCDRSGRDSCCLAELAEAILVIGNVGRNLVREIDYLTTAGLRSRVLVYADGHLHGLEPGRKLEEQRTWSLEGDGASRAVIHASGRSGAP